MNAAHSDGILLDKATRFGERFGFPALVAILLIAGLLYGAYFILRYEVFYTRSQVEAMSGQINTMSSQHSTILSKQEASLEMQAKELRITCAACWNNAGNQTEIKRCGCNPDSL